VVLVQIDESKGQVTLLDSTTLICCLGRIAHCWILGVCP
jgi:hypothetical protein